MERLLPGIVQTVCLCLATVDPHWFLSRPRVLKNPNFQINFMPRFMCRRDLGKGPCGTVRVMREMICCMDHWEKQTSQSLTTFCFCYLMSFFSIPFWSPDVNPVLLCVCMCISVTHISFRCLCTAAVCKWYHPVAVMNLENLARQIEIEVMKIASDRHYFFSLRSITKWQAMIDNLLSVAAGWLLNVNSVVLSISLHFTIDFCYSNENIFTQCSLYFYITFIVQTNSRHNRLSISSCSFIS